MSSSALDYLNALLALSGDPLFSEAREKLFEKLGDEDLSNVIKSCMENITSREEQKNIVSFLLDITVQRTIKLQRKTRATVSVTNPEVAKKRGQPADDQPQKWQKPTEVTLNDVKTEHRDNVDLSSEIDEGLNVGN